MPMQRAALRVLGLSALLLVGCLQSTLQMPSDLNLTPRDKLLLAMLLMHMQRFRRRFVGISSTITARRGCWSGEPPAGSGCRTVRAPMLLRDATLAVAKRLR
jgi:hypothetical protein